MKQGDVAGLCGWMHLPAEIERTLAGLPAPTFDEAAPQLRGSGERSDVWFWAAEQRVVGRVLVSYRQRIGDCVGHGWARAAQNLMLIEIANGEPEEVPADLRAGLGDGSDGLVSTEAIYGGSRCEIGGRWGSRSDGSVGAWAAKWVNAYGILVRRRFVADGLSVDLRRYDPARARDWGARGVPDPLEPLARAHPVRAVTQVRSYEQVRDMLANGYPVPVASSRGFTMKRRPGGWCDPRGTWMHQMTCRGHLVTRGNRPAVVVQNSWGDYLGDDNARVALEDGREVVLPAGCFLAEPEVVAGMARQGDTFGISRFQGFPRREVIPWVFAAEDNPRPARRSA